MATKIDGQYTVSPPAQNCSFGGPCKIVVTRRLQYACMTCGTTWDIFIKIGDLNMLLRGLNDGESRDNNEATSRPVGATSRS